MGRYDLNAFGIYKLDLKIDRKLAPLKNKIP